ncbi:unnamed protein product [Caenorhabditis bovis]|uniref:Phorbol-ester/DAG-type domain-containing protein n=1 Tax=Caenorhabditis bovis TaxID=2654633 RepID=A0A8S1FCN9_9PELO|nr:unnamed protein product [Caenorhabditis bovis]
MFLGLRSPLQLLCNELKVLEYLKLSLVSQVIEAIMSSSDHFGAENVVEKEIRRINGLNDSSYDNVLNVVDRRVDKDKTLTQADAAKGMSFLSSEIGSVASLLSVNSNRTDTEGETVEDDDAENAAGKKRPQSTKKTKIQATFAAGKKKVMDLVVQKRKNSEMDLGSECIEIGADAGSIFDDNKESLSRPPSTGKRTPTDDKKEKKKLKKKLSDSPKCRVKQPYPKTPNSGYQQSEKIRTTKSIPFSKDVMWGQSLHFQLDPTAKYQLRYLNITVQAREVKSTPMSSPGPSSSANSTPETINSVDSLSTSSTPRTIVDKPIVLGSVSLFIPQLIDDCQLTLSNCHREIFQLKQPLQSAAVTKEDPNLSEFSRHAGYDPRLCFGDITLGFRYFPDGFPNGNLNSGEESDEEMVRASMSNTESCHRRFSPPALNPTNHDWKLWYGKSNATCAMCRGKIWLRNASCCSRCLVICHNKCVVKANQGGIVCSPDQTSQNDEEFEEISATENFVQNGADHPDEPRPTLLQSPSQSSIPPDTPETSKRARFRKVTEKFSNWRKSGRRREDENNTDRQSLVSNSSTSWSTDGSTKSEVAERDSPMASIQDVLSDVLPGLEGSPFINSLYFHPGNAYNEQTIKNAKLLGREIFSELPHNERVEKINSQIDRIQAAIRETKDDRLSVMQNGGEESVKFQGLDERLQALAVLMLHYCSALQDCQSGRSTPAPQNLPEDAETHEEDCLMAGVITTTLLGCVGCQAGIEYLQKYVKDSLNLITFSSFVFTSVYGLIFHSKFFTVSNKIPIRSYAAIVAIFFTVNMANNYALKFAIYFPLFIIFKSGTLLANMTLGYIIRGYRYSLKQILSVVVVTAGIIIFTLASYEPKNQSDAIRYGANSMEWTIPIPPFIVGIVLLSFALILSAYLGIYQETFYQRHGKHNEEMMFYIHVLSIPAFALLGDEMKSAFHFANHTPPFHIGSFSTVVPSAWVYIFVICVFQLMCTKSVYKLSSATTSLNVTMVLTLRKFLSLLISFLVFNNSFNMFHILGAAFVFIGTFMFSTSFST